MILPQNILNKEEPNKKKKQRIRYPRWKVTPQSNSGCEAWQWPPCPLILLLLHPQDSALWQTSVRSRVGRIWAHGFRIRSIMAGKPWREEQLCSWWHRYEKEWAQKQDQTIDPEKPPH